MSTSAANAPPSFDFDDPPGDPLAWCAAWFAAADEIGMPNPNAMCLSTIDPDGRPSARIVLRKSFGPEGLVFFTNRESRKGRALAAHPVAVASFHWDVLDRQLIIEGPVDKIDDAASDTYFASRPRASQIGAWASRQSEPCSSRAELDGAFRAAEARFGDGPVPRPPHWGGYRILLRSITFWQGHIFRLHDRVRYERAGDAAPWRVARLFP